MIVTVLPQRDDVQIIPVPAHEIARDLGNDKMANMVMLGTLAAATQVLPLSVVAQTLKDHLPAKKQKFLDANLKALERGVALIETGVTV